jgi:hypothetical protein
MTFWISVIIGFALAVGAFFYRDHVEPGFWRKK